jgi:triphosphoribosyl-dephospho-CoA synthase
MPRFVADHVAAAAAALLAELETWPKPGLVSHVDSGSHADMNASTFEASTAAITPFYGHLAVAGADGAGMDALREIGLGAGAQCWPRPAASTRSVAQSSAWAFYARLPGLLGLERRALSGTGEPTCSAPSCASDGGKGYCAAPSHYAVMGQTRCAVSAWAGAQAAAGFPHAIEFGLPALRLGRRLAPSDPEAARVQGFFALLASMEDTNLLHRGGGAGLRYAQEEAAGFLRQGGVEQAKWRERAAAVHRAFVARNLSPGGCADLLAITLFLDALEAHT